MKFLTKRNIIIAAAVVVVVLFVSIFAFQLWKKNNPTYLTKAKRTELFNAICSRDPNIPYEPGEGMLLTGNFGEHYYYGTYNGYDAIYVRSGLGYYVSLWIGEELFVETTGAILYLHRDGEFIELWSGYDYTQHISADDLRAIAQIHFDRVTTTDSHTNIYLNEYERLGFAERYEK